MSRSAAVACTICGSQEAVVAQELQADLAGAGVGRHGQREAQLHHAVAGGVAVGNDLSHGPPAARLPQLEERVVVAGLAHGHTLQAAAAVARSGACRRTSRARWRRTCRRRPPCAAGRPSAPAPASARSSSGPPGTACSESRSGRAASNTRRASWIASIRSARKGVCTASVRIDSSWMCWPVATPTRLNIVPSDCVRKMSPVTCLVGGMYLIGQSGNSSRMSSALGPLLHHLARPVGIDLERVPEPDLAAPGCRRPAPARG